jgi:hypothetical protein
MHLADWNGVPESLRHQGLDNMLAKYRPLLMSPSAWDAIARGFIEHERHPAISSSQFGRTTVASVNAHDRFGSHYVETVKRRLTRFIRNQNAPPAWDYLWRRAREIEQQDWPWMARSRSNLALQPKLSSRFPSR